ncbi:MAG: PorT family protein [Muribaculaceae bacterium]|nr:PorT family protein [Muribaculaceae bacterium]
MKRTALAFIAAASLSVAATAQNYLVENPDNKPYLGLRIGLDISSTAGPANDIYGNGPGFTIGAVYNIPLWKNLYFEPGVSLFYDTFNAEVEMPEPDGKIDLLDGSIRNWGFRVPLNAGYRFDFTDDISISLFTGPVINANISAHEHYPGHSSSVMEKGFKRFDLQWDFGASLTYNHNYYVAVSGAVGMTKAYSLTDEFNFRRNTCNIAIGYNF